MASVSLNCKNRRTMVIGNFLPPFFGIRCSKTGCIHQFANQHCQMPALASLTR